MTQEQHDVSAEISAAEKRLKLSFPSNYRQFLLKHAGKLAPLGAEVSAGLWLFPEELMTGDFWPLFDEVSEEDFEGDDLSKLIVIHQSHNHQYFLVLDYRLDIQEPGLMLLRKEEVGVELVQQFVSFDEFLETLERHAHFKAAYLPDGAE